MPNESLIIKYRPKTFKQVIGQQDTAMSFEQALTDKRSHTFLFAGQGGIGKTTFARLGAAFLGSNNVIEVDAATYSGVDEVRSLTEGLNRRTLGRSGPKCYILDEVQRFSKSAWDALLKPLEEPPEWVYWFLCTTNLAAVPQPIQTRATVYTLKPVGNNKISDFLYKIADKEGLDTPDEVLNLCGAKAGGSPREALSLLSAVYGCADRKAAVQIIEKRGDDETATGYELAKALFGGKSTWKTIQPILAAMQKSGENPEGVRQVVRQYFTTVILGTEDVAQVRAHFKVLDAFYEPFNSQDGFTPLVLAVGRCLLTQ